MRPIHLAVLLDQQICAGGGYQQALNAVLLTRELSSKLVKPVFFTTFGKNLDVLAGYGIKATLLKLPLPRLVALHIRSYIQHPLLIAMLKRFAPLNWLEKQLLSLEIDLVYFTSPTSLPRVLERLNYISTVWDLSHRDDPEFPEVRWNRIFENRERKYRAILPRSIAVLVDSESGRDNLARRYGIDLQRVHVMPFEPAQSVYINEDEHKLKYIDISVKYGLDVPYVFYPAQFWAHKNHVYLLEGLKDLEKRYGRCIGAIFAGDDKGNLGYIKEYTHMLSLDDRIRFAGFVPNEEIPYLYRQSIALVMPTYFGPTNLPPLEAFELGVPVLYPEKPSFRTQVDNAALFMDLKNPSTMADNLAALLSDKDLRNNLIQSGKLRLQKYKQVNRIGVLESIIEDFWWKRLCWR